MLHYNLYALHKILNAMSVLTGATASMYDRDFNQIPSSPFTYTKLNRKYFCGAIKKNFHERCVQSDLLGFNGFEDGEIFHYYHCHCGLIEIACKVYAGENLLGYVLLGPFRDENADKTVKDTLSQYAKVVPLDRKYMIESYNELPLFTEDLFTALKDIFQPLFEYIELKNYLSKKEDAFSLNIEPYVLSNLGSDLSIDFLCKHFYVSRKTLYKIFQENTGMTPLEFITKKRIEYAKKLIVSTDLTLSKIAERVGVTDYNYFIKVFKSVDGHTPGYYRKAKK